MNTLEILKNARAKLAAGWVRGSGDYRTTFCVGQAICAAAIEYKCGSDATDRVAQLLVAHFSPTHRVKSGFYFYDRMGQIISWNDNPQRTKDEILAVMDKAIAELRRSPEVESTVIRRELVPA